MKFILASASPRRLELLQQIGVKPNVIVSDFDEVKTADQPEALVQANAVGKGRSVVSKSPREAVVVAADTIVVLHGKVLGKPRDAEDAVRMLTYLSGHTHQVLTAVAVFYQGKEAVKVEKTDVEFYPLTKEQILSYLHTDEPMDKAGAYGIQGRGALLVKGINGSYSNVVGLPLGTLIRMLMEMGVINNDQLFNQGLSPRG